MPDPAPIERDVPAFPRMRGVGADGFVNIDVACRSCGYDLRALSVDAKCPECGTDVLGSLRSEQLGNADPNWLSTLSIGANWLAWALVIQVLGLCFATIAAPVGTTNHALTFIQLCVSVIWLTGVFQFSRPDPSGRGELRYGAWRRTWVIAAIVTATFDMFHVIAVVERWLPNGPLSIARLFLYAGVAYVGFQYFAKFATRIARESFHMQAMFLSYSLPLCYVALATIGMFGWTPGVALVASGGALFVIAQVMHFRLMRSFAERLRAEKYWRITE